MNKLAIPLLVEKGSAENTRLFTISDDTEDRDGDILVASGAVLDNYRKNPVVLWSHDYRNLPIGRSRSIGVTSGKLKADVEFAPSDFAQEVARLVDAGFIKAASVGFLPIESEPRTDARGRFGYRYTKWDLLEWSVVSVPSNPSALLNQAKAAGLTVDALEAEYLRIADEDPVTRDATERITEDIILRLAPSEDFLLVEGARMPVSTLRHVIAETVKRSLALLSNQDPDHVLRLTTPIKVEGGSIVTLAEVVGMIRDVIEDELRAVQGRVPRQR